MDLWPQVSNHQDTVLRRSTFLVLGLLVAGCSSAAGAPAKALPVAAAPPPKDDGGAAKGGQGGGSHAAALEQLKTAPLGLRVDKQDSVRVSLPDGERWTRVKFWGLPSLVAFRYGKDHHAIVGGFVTHVTDHAAQGACPKSFEAIAQPWVDAFEVGLKREAPQAFAWQHHIIDVDAMVAKTATLMDHDEYAGAYAAYPVWKDACLILGVAIPGRGEIERAKAVRDRFVSEVFPKLEILLKDEPKDRF
jgi:hypothetical protein